MKIKVLHIVVLYCLTLGGTRVFAQHVTPPRFDGVVVKVYMARLAAMAGDVAVEERIPADSLSAEVAVALRIDTLGRVVELRFLDNTCEGRDRVDLEPVTPRTRQVVERAVGRMTGTWSPARRADGLAVNYVQRLWFRLPLQRIEEQVNPDPLLFMGGDPYPAFYEWVRSRVGFNPLRFPGVNGRMRILFYIEPDGDITIGRVLQSPDKDLERKVIRVIQRSRGKWTPRKVNGVPQRTSYEFRCNYIGNAY